MSWLPYLVSLAIGLWIGVAYGLISVRSPAPPLIALLGLLGMLSGEVAVQWMRGKPDAAAQTLYSKTFATDDGEAMTRFDSQS